jgi:hypothetical protein
MPADDGDVAPQDVDVTPLREAFLRSGLSPYELAKRMGWKRTGSPKYDSGSVAMTLGLRPHTNIKKGKRYRYVQKETNPQRALEIANALGLDPHEVGL